MKGEREREKSKCLSASATWCDEGTKRWTSCRQEPAKIPSVLMCSIQSIIKVSSYLTSARARKTPCYSCLCCSGCEPLIPRARARLELVLLIQSIARDVVAHRQLIAQEDIALWRKDATVRLLSCRSRWVSMTENEQTRDIQVGALLSAAHDDDDEYGNDRYRSLSVYLNLLETSSSIVQQGRAQIVFITWIISNQRVKTNERTNDKIVQWLFN